MSPPASSLQTAAGLRLVGASAGSGKTYRLTEEVTRALAPGNAAGIDLEGLVGVTYTTKAQAELEARIRRVLTGSGAFERAQQLPLAYLGTVHAIGLRLLQEFALDAGLSPAVDVIPGNEGRRLLQATLESELAPDLRARLGALAVELRLTWDGRTSRADWITPVDDIMTLARGNRIAPDRLPEMGRRSIDGLLALLPSPAADGRALEASLAAALETAVAGIRRLNDGQKNTQEVLARLEAAATDLGRSRLVWSDWARVAKLKPGKRALELIQPVHAAALAYERHPRFHQQLRELTELAFEAARVGLVAYARWKAERGLLDYVDMIDRALDLVALPDVADELAGRLRLLVVDEFQDTSPIQLALFTRLHALCRRSVWVGDRKQCIFEYAGADPALMEAVTRWAEQNGGEREFLPFNYRSRPELVALCSTLFSAAFAEHGYTPEEVRSTPQRDAPAELRDLAPVGWLWLEGPPDAALAAGVARLLREPASTPVLDRNTQQVRPLRADDLAILVASNAEAARISAELHARGVATVLPRVGLLSTPEGSLVTAVLRALVDARDTLALAEIDALTGFDGQSCHAWLDAQIRARRARSEPNGAPHAEDAASVWQGKLQAVREELPLLSPAETLDRVLAAFDLPALAVRWPDPAQRLSNLEALRALAAAYEERCRYQRAAASIAGLLGYFEETRQPMRQRDEERATDEQHVGGGRGAVVISTYHRAKGLEWPVVILASLDRPRKRDAFEVAPEGDPARFDAADPLAGRWIRYWPWPFGDRRTKTPLGDRAAQSPTGKAVAERDARERVRLLYVGFTRARDHLILAAPLLKRGPSLAWLDELRDARGPLLTPPAPDAPAPTLGVRGPDDQRASIPVRAWHLRPDDAEDPAPHGGSAADDLRCWFAKTPRPCAELLSYAIAPSSAASAQIELARARVLTVQRFTRRLPFTRVTGKSWDDVGNLLHAFLAADHAGLDPTDRLAIAARLLTAAALQQSFQPEHLIGASDALRSFVDARWPAAVWRREVPVSARIASPCGARRIAGSIDLLLETPQGFVVIDHKSFPGRAEHWPQRALDNAPQLLTYAAALQMAGGTVLGTFIHFTIGGGIVEVVQDG